MSTLYDIDFAEWAFYNADLLRAGKVAEADLENIAEEIESLGRTQGRELESRIMQIIGHLLKLNLTKGIMHDLNERLWRVSAAHQRVELRKLLRGSPSLRRNLTAETLSECYADAAELFRAAFEIQPPAECPFTWDDILAGSASSK